MNKRWGALILTIPLTAVGASCAFVKAYAGNYFEGTHGCGVVVKERSPIEISREEITLRISEFPDPISGMVCPSYVSASYTFFNPTQEDETLKLYFPEGDLRYLGGEPIALPSPSPIVADDGEVPSYSLRHTFRSGYEFDAEEEVARIEDGKRADPFFSPETLVSKQVYTLTRTDARERDYANLILKYNPARTRVWYGNACGASKAVIEDGFVRLTWETSLPQCEIGLYTFGEPAETVDAFVTSDSEGTKRVDDASFLRVREGELTFAEFAASLRSAGGKDAGEDDWYNALIDLLNERRDKFGTIYVPEEWFKQDHLRTWYEYELAVPAQQSVTNTVSAALLPTVNMSGPVYRYDFLLSPAHRFASFGELKIDIETSFYLGYSSLAFQKKEGGYTLTRETLPIGELSFTLARSEQAYKSVNGGGGGLSPNMRLAVIVLCVLVGGGIAAGVAAVIVGKKRRR